MFPRRLLVTPIAVFGLACVLSAGTVAAYTATTGNTNNQVQAGSVNLTDNDGGSAMLGLTNAGSGASDRSCIRVTSNGSLATAVRMTASSTGTLASHLLVKVVRGSGAAGFDDCTGFVADSRDYYGLGNGVVYDGRLSDMPTVYSSAIQDPSDARFATSVSPLLAARTSLLGLWEMGERTRRADDFSGTPGALLTSRAELYGAAWTRQAVSTTNAVFTASGRIRNQEPGTAIYRQTTANAAEVITADVTVRSATGEAGILTRMPTTGDTGYLIRYVASTGTWQAGTMNAGTFAQLDSWAGAIPTGGTARLAISQSGTSLQVSIDGVLRMNITDGTIASTGRTGVRLVGVGPQDDGAGVHLDNFRSYQPNQASTVASTGTAATAIGGPVVTAGAHPSPTDEQWGVSFNGTSQALSLPATGLTTAATIAGWFKITSGSVTLRDSTTGAATGWSLGFDDGSGTLKFRSSDEVFDTGIPFASLRGTWHHHALVRNGTAVQYYLDGRLVFTGTAANTTAPTSPFIVMRDGTDASYSAGQTDQVGVWARALGADEIAAIHDAVSAPADWQQGDSHWYRIDVTVDESPAAASSSGTATFTWEGRSR
ncbi:MAG: LamG domain-containing protein [Solirubrobacteraceae bacterium]|nr:LamG domain-containing protein [Solirubrobacteraceae bacterium]